MTPDTSSSGEKTKDPPGRLEKAHDWLTSPGARLIRYLLVLVIVGLSVYLSLTGWFQVCEVVESEKDGLTRTCSGPDLTSAGVLATVIFVVLLLWPDLSEFSAFGVTLKKLVQKVDEKVTKTRDTATHIDDTTTETKSRIASLQTAVISQGVDISEKLSLIESGLESLNNRPAAPDPAPMYPTGPTLRPAPRWDQFDQGNFITACQDLFGSAELESAIDELQRSIGFPDWSTAADRGIDVQVAAYEGLILELFRRLRSRWDTQPSAESGRSLEIDAILRSIEWMLLAIIGGKPIDHESLRAALGVLLLLDRSGG